MFYSLIKSYETLNITVIPFREQCIDNMKGEVILKDEDIHLVMLRMTLDIE